MGVTYERKEIVKEKILEKNYQLTCTNPRCFTTWQIKGVDYDRTLREEGKKGLRCPKCRATLL
jgi:hypothetical protein